MTAALWTRSRARPIVGARSGETCELDGWYPAQSLSHRRPVSLGGTWAPSNLLHLCGSGSGPDGCHGWLEGHPTWAGEGWWQIRRDRRRPLEVPVFLQAWHGRAGAGWYLLDDAGDREQVDPGRWGLPEVPLHLPWQTGRPVVTAPWVEPM